MAKVIFAICLSLVIIHLAEAGLKRPKRGFGGNSGSGCERGNSKGASGGYGAGNNGGSRVRSGGYNEDSSSSSNSPRSRYGQNSDTDSSKHRTSGNNDSSGYGGQNSGSGSNGDRSGLGSGRQHGGGGYETSASDSPERDSPARNGLRDRLLHNFEETRNRHQNQGRKFRTHRPRPRPGPEQVDIRHLHNRQGSSSSKKTNSATTPSPAPADDEVEESKEPSPIDEALNDKTYNVFHQLLEMDKTTAKPTASSSDKPSSLLTPSSPAEAMYLHAAAPGPGIPQKYPSIDHQQNDLFLGLYGGLDLSGSSYGGLLGNYYRPGAGYDSGLPAFGGTYPAFEAGTGVRGYTLHG